MSRQTSKPKRKAAAIQVPDLKEDAAERKRALNVLAQRRYRERKREHLKKLESQLEHATSPSAQSSGQTPPHDDHRKSTDEPPQEPSLIADNSETTVCPQNIELNSIPASFDDTLGLSSEWNPEAFNPSYQSWPMTALLPSLSNSPITTPSSTTSPLSDRTTDDETSPSSLNSPDWSPLHDLDITSSLQTLSTQNYTFPDEYHTEILELKLLRGAMTIAKRLNVEDLLWSLESVSPFTDPSLAGLNFDYLPVNLRPTKTQLTIPHHPIFDILAWPSVRDKLILIFSQDPTVRPCVAASPTALLELVYDLEDSAEGVRIWGEDPCIAENWEAGEAVFKKWWWALDSQVIRRSNALRKQRGAAPLGGGFVVGEV